MAEFDDEHAAHLDAEKLAAVPETEARMLREQLKAEKSNGFFDRLFGH